MADGEYSELRSKVVVTSDTSGLDKVTEGIKEAKQAADDLSKSANTAGSSIGKLGKVGETLEKINDQIGESKTAKFTTSIEKSGLVAQKTLVGEARKVNAETERLQKEISSGAVARETVRKSPDALRREALEENLQGFPNGKPNPASKALPEYASRVQELQERLDSVISANRDFADGAGTVATQAERAANSVNEYANATGRAGQATSATSPASIGIPGSADATSSNALGELGNKFAWLSNIGGTVQSVMNGMSGALGSVGSAAASAASMIGGFVKAMGQKAIGNIKKFTSSLGNVINSFKRIAFYRFVRSVIRAITEGFKEGVNNLYQWSKAVNGQFAKSMDTISTATLYMKNSLGAMVAPLINAIAPAIDFLIDKFVDLLNVINRVFALVTGAGTWTKAKKYPKEYAESVSSGAGKATEALHKLGLAQIDELTILDKNHGDNASGGGGGSGMDYSSMFEEQDIGGGIWDKIKEAIESGKWREAGKILAEQLNEIVKNFDAVAWGKKIGEKINNGLEFAYGFLKFTDFQQIGSKIAEFINGSLESINFDTLGRLLVRKKTALLDALIGFVTSVDWKLVGTSIHDFFIGAMNEGMDFLRGVDWFKLGVDLFFAVKSLFEGIDFDDIVSTFFHLLGLAFGSLTNLIMGAILGVVDSIVNYFTGFIQDENNDGKFGGEEIINGLLEGIADGVIGIGEWIWNNVFKPIYDGICEAFGIHSPAETMKPIGENIIAGVKEGISKKWTDMVNWMKQKWESFKSWWRNLELPSFKIKKPKLTWTTEPVGGVIGNILNTLGLPSSLPHLNVEWYASGGFPDAGQLFVANEAGAEMVGSMDGRTAVANNQQIVEGIRAGVYDAVTSAMAQGSLKANVYLDGKQISGTVVSNINSETRRTGNSPLLSF